MGKLLPRISTKTMLLEIERTLRPKDNSWLNDAPRSILMAIKGIGTSVPLVDIQKDISIASRRGKLPTDARALRAVVYKGQRIPLSIGVVGAQNNNTSGYTINGGYLVCPFNKGVVTAHYRGIPLDCDGFPEIIDDFDYILAVKWYVMADMLSNGYEHKVFSYRDAWAKWEEHSAKACNSIKMPASRDELEALGNIWTDTFNDGEFVHHFGQGMEYGDDNPTAYYLPTYLDRNRLANNS